MYVWITAGTHLMSLNDIPSFDCPQYRVEEFLKKFVFFFLDDNNCKHLYWPYEAEETMKKNISTSSLDYRTKLN